MDADTNKMADLFHVAVDYLTIVNELDEVGSRIHNAGIDPGAIDLEGAKKTLKRLHGEAMELSAKLNNNLDKGKKNECFLGNDNSDGGKGSDRVADEGQAGRGREGGG